MCQVAKGPHHGPAPIPEEGKWVKAKEITDISGMTHGIGWCAPQQGACKLSLNIKNGIIEEALVETLGCSGMTHSAAMASEILIGKTILEALNTDLVCDAINTAMRELFLQIVYGRSQTAFSEGGLPIGGALEDLGKGLTGQVGTLYATNAKGPRYLQLTEANAEPWPLVMQLLRERHTTWAAGEELKRQLAQEKKKSEAAAGKQASAEKSLSEAKAALTTSESALAAARMMLETAERDLAVSREAQSAAKSRARIVIAMRRVHRTRPTDVATP